MDTLESHYDLCIQGTGLVESIVACAAAKCGIKVIHLDKSDCYGGNFSSLGFDTFSRLGHCDASSTLDEGSSFSNSESSLISVIGSAPRLDVVEAGEIGTATESSAVENPRRELFTKAMKASRYFSIDLTSKLMLCSGRSVDCFLKSGVSEYLEFKSIEALHYLASPEEVLKVPCSKSDVFNSKLLTAMEKRLLTKFLQFVDDYGREAHGRSVATLNENDLASGRSLHRPQNKSFDSSGFRIAEFEDKPFSEFMTFCKIPTSLQTIIVHALSLSIRGTTSAHGHAESHTANTLITSAALAQLANVLNSLGRYGDTALLATVYGTAEIVQSFCRMAAVWGATYVLREHVVSVTPYREDPAGTAIIKDQSVSNSSSSGVSSSTDTPAESHIQSETDKPATDQEGDEEEELGPNFPVSEPMQKRLFITDSQNRSFTCNSFVTSVQDTPVVFLSSSSGDSTPPQVLSFPVHSCLLTRVCVLSGAVLPHIRSVLVIPPRTRGLENTHAVMVTQQDASMMVCAEGYFLLHITTLIDCAGEESRPIAWLPRPVVAATSTDTNTFSWSEHVAQRKLEWSALLDRAATTLLGTTAKSASDPASAPIEVHYINAVRPLFSIDANHVSIIPFNESASSHSLPEHSSVQGDDGSAYSLTVDDCVAQAERLFHHLFSEREFMFPAKSALAMTENSQFEEEFDEIHYYKSALSPESSSIKTETSHTSTAILAEGTEARTAAHRDDIIYVPMVPRTDI